MHKPQRLARWIYYAINPAALAALNAASGAFFDSARMSF
jgi:hypothetical protein